MAYPQEFSSTLTYETKYNLDQIDVFLEGDGRFPMFFNVNGLPNQLSFGKHYFNISIISSNKEEYELRHNYRILFEFKSKNGVVLKSDITSLKQRNGVATCFVEVLEDPLYTMEEIEDGQGTLTVVGSLDNKENTKELIPEKFLGAMNYRCIFPIEIRKNLLNANSPLVLQAEHKVQTINGQFSFRKAAISSTKNSTLGLEYNPITGKPIQAHTGKPGGGS